MSEEREPVQAVISAVDAIKLDLMPGDTLAITIKSDDLDEYLIANLKKKFEEMFEGNRILIMGVGANEDVQYTVISENKENKACSTENYCVDCNCGKKEQFKGESNG